MNLQGKKVGIRSFRPEDILPFHEAVRESIDHLQPFLPWAHAGYSMEEARSWVESRPDAWKDSDEYSFVLYSLTDGRLLGGMGINRIDHMHRIGNIGYWVRKSALGQGTATEGTRLIARFGFEEQGLSRLEIIMLHTNPASRRVAEKAGASLEGLQRNRLVVDGQSMDACMYSLIPGDLFESP
jgi:RimJ/RimL family protein N-acetyltransferase